MKNIALSLSAALLAATLSACGGGTVDTAGVTSAPTVASSAPVATTEAPQAKNVLKFGEIMQYEDGLSVLYTPVGPAQASEQAAGAEATGGQVYLFDITITNGSSEQVDAVMFYDTAVYGPSGTSAEKVFDGANGFSNNFQGIILPGNSQTVRVGFAVPTAEAGTLQVTASPSFEHKAIVFTGGI